MDYRYYRNEALDNIARNAIKSYDASLLSEPSAIPIEDIMEKVYGLVIIYQRIRKTGLVLAETAFDDTFIAVYDDEKKKYIWLPVERGTVVVDASLLDTRGDGRLRFTLAHELAHWIIHKYIYEGTCQTAAKTESALISSESDGAVEWQADKLGSLLLMPAGQVKMAFNRNRSALDSAAVLAKIFDVSKQAMSIRLKELHLS